MKLERLDGGAFTVPAGIIRRGEDIEQRLLLPVPAYLIETGTERILVDTGLHPDSAADPVGRYGSADAFGPFAPQQSTPLADQVDLSTITMVVLTHLHYDHAGGLDLVPESVPLVIQRTEWEAGLDDDATARNFYLRADFARTEREIRLIDGEHDLLGDGSITLLPTPGHTPGHQSVKVGDFVIGGDVVHFTAGLEDHRFPIFADDHAAQKSSAEQLRALRDSGLTVFPGHDPEVLVPGPISG